MRGESLTVYRGTTDKRSNPNKEPHGTIEGIFAWGSSGKGSALFGLNNDRAESASVTAQLYVTRGTDLKARDRVQRANGEQYAIVGHQQWGEDFPFGDGYDDDVDDLVVFQVESTNG